MKLNSRTTLILSFFIFAFFITNCACGQIKEIVDITGTIKYFSFEGGFYGIVGDNGKNYDPMKLDKIYCKDNLRVKVLGIVRDDVMSTKNWGTILEINNIEILEESSKQYDFEIHEWGVMMGCKLEENYFNTSRPEIITLVKQPVVYVHSKNKIPFSLKVTFNSGKPTSVYPITDIDENRTGWKDVKFDEPSKGLKESIDTSRLQSLESIMNILNDVDADELKYNNTTSRFLFYEGEMAFNNKIMTSYEPSKGEVTITNNFPYQVNNVVFSTAEGNFMNAVYLYGVISELKPGESKTIKLTNQQADIWTNDLISLGFTEKEAKSFSNLWDRPFLERTNQSNWSNLIYRLPQEELEKMIALEFNPQPDKIIRVLYVLINL